MSADVRLCNTASFSYQQSAIGPSNVSIPIPLSEFRIKSIVASTLNSIYTAAGIINTNNSTVSPPGDHNDKSLIVMSKTNPTRQHSVKILSNKSIKCDDNCVRFKTFKLCSHILAVAEKTDMLQDFLTWFKSQKQSSNLTKLTTHRILKSVGKKTMKSTSKQKGSSNH